MFSILIQQHDSFVLGLSNAGKPNLVCTMGPFVVVQSLSCIHLFATPWTAAFQASLSFIISQSLLKLISTESVILSSHLIHCRPFLLLPSIPPRIKVLPNESTLPVRWPKYWGCSFSPSNEYSGLISFRTD